MADHQHDLRQVFACEKKKEKETLNLKLQVTLLPKKKARFPGPFLLSFA